MTEQPTPLTDQQLDDIEARATHERLTPGPWKLDRESCDCSDGYCHHGAYVTGVVTPVPTEIAAERCERTGEQPRDYDFHRSEIGDFAEADWELMVHARTDVPALLDEVRRLRAERDEYCNRVDTLTAVAKGNKRHVQEMFQELQKAQAALEQIRHLHKDSPMGPCPVCIDADAVAAGRDGLVPYPCPTGRLAGAQDCDPPSSRAAASAVSGAADSRQP